MDLELIKAYRNARKKLFKMKLKYNKYFKVILFKKLIYAWYNLSCLVIILYVSIKNMNFINVH